MRKLLFITAFMIGIVAIQAYSQCRKVHYFCTSLLSEEQQEELWTLNNQSKSAAFEKGKEYKMSFIAYKGFDYRISVCTDIIEGGDKVRFQLFQDARVLEKDEYGNTNIVRKKELLYNNEDDNLSPTVSFTVDQTKKFYLTVQVPNQGESKERKLKTTDYVCVGVLLEHKRGQELGF